ncbi:unnamed protein product [Somion occarium]|uniref:Uncharacterized protein n=1 Tax=Somion occarium TaxID=3059160 RepID=A0ABP1CT32_9APHY
MMMTGLMTVFGLVAAFFLPSMSLSIPINKGNPVQPVKPRFLDGPPSLLNIGGKPNGTVNASTVSALEETQFGGHTPILRRSQDGTSSESGGIVRVPRKVLQLTSEELQRLRTGV